MGSEQKINVEVSAQANERAYLIFIFGQNEETKKQRKTTFGRFLLKELINVFGMENVRRIKKS